jgi:hypothetical protein
MSRANDQVYYNCTCFFSFLYIIMYFEQSRSAFSSRTSSRIRVLFNSRRTGFSFQKRRRSNSPSEKWRKEQTSVGTKRFFADFDRSTGGSVPQIRFSSGRGTLRTGELGNCPVLIKMTGSQMRFWSENFFRRATYILFPGSELVSCDTVKSFAPQAKIGKSFADQRKSFAARYGKLKSRESSFLAEQAKNNQLCVSCQF